MKQDSTLIEKENLMWISYWASQHFMMLQRTSHIGSANYKFYGQEREYWGDRFNNYRALLNEQARSILEIRMNCGFIL